ncbi:hypothetical protein ACF3NA_00735 [Alkanindiges sp. WGS2144]|uniref:hypothetical protein n=1 Tax=Alkanindiges sp. WGS2144 TaxID=3366808 RepID=UPI00375088B6
MNKKRSLAKHVPTMISQTKLQIKTFAIVRLSSEAEPAGIACKSSSGRVQLDQADKKNMLPYGLPKQSDGQPIVA